MTRFRCLLFVFAAGCIPEGEVSSADFMFENDSSESLWVERTNTYDDVQMSGEVVPAGFLSLGSSTEYGSVPPSPEETFALVRLLDASNAEVYRQEPIDDAAWTLTPEDPGPPHVATRWTLAVTDADLR